MKKKISLFAAKVTFQREVLNGLDLKYDLNIAKMAWFDWMKQIGCNYAFPEYYITLSNK